MADQLKDMFFTDKFIAELSDSIRKVYPVFDVAALGRLVHTDDFDEMALKKKMRHLTTCLYATLPEDYPEALDILLQVGPSFGGFDAMVFPDFVECYGLEHWDLSMSALGEFTLLCSAEFAVRPFIAADAERAMVYMNEWSKDENEHRRRLSSEGCRPRLPWAMALPAFKADPSPILPILGRLKDDPAEYVRKSVANNLNDIAKDNPDIVLDTCERWHGFSPRTDWIVKRGCRTLLKSGNTRALMLFGFGDPAGISVEGLTLSDDQPHIGEAIHFTCNVNVDVPALLRLEYAVTYMKARGKRSRKVFHIGEAEYDRGKHTIARKVSFKDLSTRKHYPGEHEIAIIVNGVEKASAMLMLRAF